MENTNIKNEQEKQPKTPKELTLFILRIVGNVLFYSAIAVLFFFSLMNINAGRKNGIPNIFGNGYLRVLTNSMHVDESALNNLPEEYKNYKIKQFNCTETEEVEGKTKILYKGDVVNVKMTGKSYFKKFKVGDVVTYWDNDIEIDKSKGGFNTHRIVYIGKDENGKNVTIYTAGDRDISLKAELREEFVNLKNAWEKRYSGTETEKTEARVFIQDFENKYNGDSTVSCLGEGQIKAKVTSVNYKAGYTIYWIQQNWLFIFVIPLAVILAVEVALVVRNIILLRREKNKAATPEGQGIDLESEKERLRAELLAELQSQGVIAAAPAEEKIEEPKAEETSTVETEAPQVEETKEAPVEEATEEKVEETKAEAEKAKEEVSAEPVQEEVQEEVKEEAAEAPVEEAKATEEATKEEEPVVNNEEAVKEPDMSIEENEEEPKAEEKKTPVKKAPSKKTSTTKKASTTKKTEK